MGGKKWIWLCKEWLVYKWPVLLYYAIFNGLLFFVNYMYGCPWEATGYVLLLGAGVGVVFAGVNFTRFACDYLQLNKLAGRYPTGELPPGKSLVQKEYNHVVMELEAERSRLAETIDWRQKDALEYYTLWVHQIKTPIAALSLLLQNTGGQMVPQEKAAMEQELYRIEQYVGMVLQYQRLGSMNSDFDFEEYSIEALVKKALKASAPLFIWKKLPLAMGEIQGSVITDAKWFVFVLEQLLSNALKYTHKGSVSIYTLPGSPQQGGTQLVIQDTGMGISPQDLPRVFERGFTGATGREHARATGIGLYLCKKILDKLGFGISIQSAPGQGTTVTLQLWHNQLEVE